MRGVDLIFTVVAVMSADDQYSRLTALAKLGVVPNYADIRNKGVLIVGLGGIGSVAAEMLTRCGVGRLVVVDYDVVEMANMNRMFFTPSQIGMTKVDAAVATLRDISCGQVDIRGIHGNITSVDTYNILRSELSSTRVDLALCCVDNYAARMTMNRLCLEAGKVWLESGVSETAMSGHIQLMHPGRTACFECAPPLVVAEEGDEHKALKREGVCAASLPTTMSIIGGLLAQNALKYMLNFGEVSGCVGYNALNDFFPSYAMKPNPDCTNDRCRELTSCWVDEHENAPVEARVDLAIGALHAVNEWGIEIAHEELVIENQRTSDELEGGSATLEGLSVAELRSRLKR